MNWADAWGDLADKCLRDLNDLRRRARRASGARAQRLITRIYGAECRVRFAERRFQTAALLPTPAETADAVVAGVR